MAGTAPVPDDGAMNATTDPTTEGPAAERGPAPPPPAARLRRSTTDRHLGGVAGGIGTYLGIDPVLVRIVFVLAVFAGGSGLLAYLIAWAVMPEDDGTVPTSAVSAGRNPDAARVAGIGALVLAAMIAFGGRWPGDGLLLPLALIAGGAWLLLRPGTGVGGAAIRTGPASGVDDPGTGPAATASTPSPPPPPHAPAPPTPAPGPAAPVASRSPTTRITVGLLALLAGLLGVAGAAGADISLRGGLLALLALTSVGLLVGAFTGGARALIVPAALLLAAIAVVSALDVPLRGGVGERRYTPATVAEVDEAYRLGLGELTLDLRGLDPEELEGTTLPIEVSVVAGEVLVLVPDDVVVDVGVSITAGEADILGRRANGTGVDVAERRPGTDSGAGTLVLDIRAGLGAVTVR